MRIVFLGTPELAVAPLAHVSQHHDVTALVCQPDRPQGRSNKLVAPPTKLWALEHGIPVHQPTRLNDGVFEAWLREQAPDVCCLCAYGRILKQPILDVPKHGFLNVHPSLLPKYRGTSPIQTAIVNGDAVTGVTIMRLDAGMDTGDIVLQEEHAIVSDDTTLSLSAKLSEHGAQLLVSALDLVARGEAVFAPQDHAKATHTKPFDKDDGRIRWSASARAIHNQVRACVPWPMAHSVFQGETCRVHQTRVLDVAACAKPGTITRVTADHVEVATGDGTLAIDVFQAPGKRAMPMAEYLRGRIIKTGDSFENDAEPGDPLHVR